MREREPVRPVHVLDDQEPWRAGACPLDQPRHGRALALVAAGVVHGVVERAQLDRLRQVEQVVEEHGVRLGHEAVGQGRAGRGSGRLGPAGEVVEAEQPAHEGPDRVPAGAGAEVEHEPGMAGEAGLLGRVLELLDQTGLADSGLAPHEHGPAAPAPDARVKDGAELAELGVAADERSAGRGRRRGHSPQAPGEHRIGKTLDGERSGLLAVEPVDKRPPHCVGDQDLTRPRGVSQSRGEVHRVARDRVLAVGDASGAAGDHLAAGDADVNRNRPPRLRGDGGHRVADGQRRPHRPLGVVAVGDWRAEDRHDTVADVLVDPAAMLGDEAVGAGEEALQEGVHLLRVKLAAERGVAGEVGEDDRDLPPLALEFRRGRHLWRVCPQCRDCVEELPPVADRHHA